MSDYRTCTHTYDDGGACNSAAVTGQKYCIYHLRYRARQLRLAQLRARRERFDLKLPPLESMHAVHSALTQLAEALAADMIDPKRADKLLAVLRLASRNLLKSDKWPASPYHSDQPGPAVDLAAEYGLPKDLNLDLPPEVAFPSPAEGAPPLSPSFGDRVGAVAGGVPGLFPMPTVAYCKDGPGCPEHTIRADYPTTPEMVEIQEITLTQGGDAAVIRGRQLDRNWNRRQLRTDRKRYAAVAWPSKNSPPRSWWPRRPLRHRQLGARLLLAGWGRSPTPARSPSLLRAPATPSPPRRTPSLNFSPACPELEPARRARWALPPMPKCVWECAVSCKTCPT